MMVKAVQAGAIVDCPAKINLVLTIKGTLANGYHEVETIMQQIDLCDTVEVSLVGTGGISISCDAEGIPTDERNLCHKAAALFFNHMGIKGQSAEIRIQKKIPAQAGLAGGSTDGAGCLKALNQIYGNPLDIHTLRALGGKIGADVPFCVDGRTCLATGLGDQLEEVDALPPCWIVVVKPPIGSSTAEAYGRYDSMELAPFTGTGAVLEALKARDLKAVACGLHNDFEEILQLEEVRDIKAQLLEGGAIGALMSGSGTAVYGLFDLGSRADAAYRAIKEQYPGIWICRPIQ